MTVEQVKETLNLRLLAGEAGLSREVTGCYVGDLLSWVMGRASEGDAWLTVVGNINAIAVSTLADTACIILTENAPLDDDAAKKAEIHGVAVLQTEESGYRMALRFGELLR